MGQSWSSFPFQESSLTDRPRGTSSGRGAAPQLGTLWGLLSKPELQEAFLGAADAALQGASQKAEDMQETTAAKSPLVTKFRCSKWDWEQTPAFPEAEHKQNPSNSGETEPRFCKKPVPGCLTELTWAQPWAERDKARVSCDKTRCHP